MQNNSSGRKIGLPWSSGTSINRKKGIISSKAKNNQSSNNGNNNGTLHRQSSKNKEIIEVSNELKKK